jgi:hypothetical protein
MTTPVPVTDSDVTGRTRTSPITTGVPVLPSPCLLVPLMATSAEKTGNPAPNSCAVSRPRRR